MNLVNPGKLKHEVVSRYCHLCKKRTLHYQELVNFRYWIILTLVSLGLLLVIAIVVLFGESSRVGREAACHDCLKRDGEFLQFRESIAYYM